MEEVKLDAKNIEDNKKKAIAQRLNINVEDIPQEIVDNDELGDLLIFGGEVKESFAASARKIKESGIETISMGYILVDGGRESATARITGTRPLPAADSERIADTALAGEMLGFTPPASSTVAWTAILCRSVPDESEEHRGYQSPHRVHIFPATPAGTTLAKKRLASFKAND